MLDFFWFFLFSNGEWFASVSGLLPALNFWALDANFLSGNSCRKININFKEKFSSIQNLIIILSVRKILIILAFL